MTIAVGVVFHRAARRPPVRAEPGVDVLVRTNASAGDPATPWLGFGANHNRLLREATGAEWYVTLNPDARADAGDIKRLVAAAEAADLDVAAPLLALPWGVGGAHAELPGPGQWLRETVGLGGAGRAAAPGDDGTIARSAWVSGACMALRTTRAEARFDEDYFMYFEDAALCHRVSEAGGAVGVCTEVRVDHRSGWERADELRWRRGVEFARSALRFAAQVDMSASLTRLAGFIRFGSRVALPGRSSAERVAARVIARGFAQVRRAPGLNELAAEFNATRTA